MASTSIDALAEASFRGDSAAIVSMLSSGGGESAVNARDSAGFSPLHRACVSGAADAVRVLLAHGAAVNGTDAFGDTPLHLASFCGHLELVRILLSEGANTAALSGDGRTAIAVAAEEGHSAIVQALVVSASAAAGEYPNKGEPLPTAADSYASIAAQYNALVGQLGDAAFAGDARGVFALLAAGADVNGMDADGFSALHRAAAGGTLAVLELLIGHGGDVNARDLAGCTPLHYAAFCGHTDVVHLLLSAGADPTRRNRDSCVPVDIAKAEGRSGVDRLLSGTFTKVESLDFSYGVALEGELAAKRHSMSIVGSALASLTRMGLFAWKTKYAVLSRTHRSLFLWTGECVSIITPCSCARTGRC